ncbi:hypothetical protein EVAR_20082_1 [Eumeta japonica]|uniref:Uncharacterized protein n=1 Tax=Eumeta variegata TaxID=151549 RepID=A0A4C1UJD4_EUMVA|nr:hypothetical protein EVAR_20082_1 [Eumeta japonica]
MSEVVQTNRGVIPNHFIESTFVWRHDQPPPALTSSTELPNSDSCLLNALTVVMLMSKPREKKNCHRELYQDLDRERDYSRERNRNWHQD